MELIAKLAVLADAAKCDASCASNGSNTRNSLANEDRGDIGSTSGTCNAYAPPIPASTRIELAAALARAAGSDGNAGRSQRLLANWPRMA